MAKTKTAFFCQNCGAQYAKWQGQCNSCKQWNTISEEVIQKACRMVNPSLDGLEGEDSNLLEDDYDLVEDLKTPTDTRRNQP